MIITPLEALEPYKAAAAPPFNTEIDSTSSGFNAEIPSPESAPPQTPAEPRFELLIVIPSIT